MKSAIKLVFACLICQLLGGLIAAPIGMLISYVQAGEVDQVLMMDYTMPLAMVVQFALMLLYIGQRGYLTGDSRLYAPVKLAYLGFVLLTGLGAIFLEDELLRLLQMPDWMEANFSQITESWLGIACVTLIGPIVEELLFRGAVTKELLRVYNPSTAIVISGLLFGLIHINPAQVLGASFIGILLAWLYWRTGSLIPCMVLHVFNNALTVWFGKTFPASEHFRDILPEESYLVILAVAVVALLGGLHMLFHYKSPIADYEIK